MVGQGQLAGVGYATQTRASEITEPAGLARNLAARPVAFVYRYAMQVLYYYFLRLRARRSKFGPF